MSKFKIKMKLQGLELEIEGAREDAQLITQNLSQQMAGLIQPAGAILEGEFVKQPTPALLSTQEDTIGNLRKKTRRARGAASSSTTDVSSAIDWVHDPAKYGTPKFDWNTATKAMWTLYVAKEEGKASELSTAAIIATFNKHFKQAGMVRNVARDLGKLKKNGSLFLVEDTTKDPSVWLLTDEGRKHVQKLISDTLTQAAAA